VLPVVVAEHEPPAALLVAGLSPRRALDDDYRGFLALVANQIASAIGAARAYEAERQRAEALAELDRSKTAFFSNVSHEFRTPLTLMLGPLEQLRQDAGAWPDASRERLEMVQRNALRLLKLVNTLLDFSRIEAGRIRAVYAPTDLAALTSDLAGVFRSAIEQAGLRLIVRCPPLPEPIYVDRDMWEQIVFNLISNAFKFTFAGEIEVALRPAGERVELTIRDTGIGIPPDELPRLFERFHRVTNARGRIFEGSGIGLALVQELVRLHGGSLRVASAPDQGTTFTISVPTGTAHLPAGQISDVPLAVPAGQLGRAYVEEMLRWLPEPENGSWELGVSDQKLARPQPPTPDSRRLVLVADDNADMRAYIRRLLGQRYEVVAVGDGAAALRAIHKAPVDLVLADVMMPQLDGFELLAALRADERTNLLPIILLSARAGEEARVEGIAAGADDYLIKPFSAQELLARVETHLALARLRRDAELRVRESESRFRQIADAAPVMIWLSDTANQCIWFNQFWLDFTGRALEQELGNGWTDGIHPEDYDRYMQADAQSFSAREPLSIEYRLRRHDGEYRCMLDYGVPRFAPDGQFVGYIGTCIDIEDRKQAERAGQLANERFRLAEEASNGFVYDWLVDTDDVERSDGFTKVLGYQLDEIGPTGAAWRALIHPDDLARIMLLPNAPPEERRRGSRYEYRVRHKNGSWVWVLDENAAMERDGKLWRVVGSTVDITYRKVAEAALREAQARRLAEEQEHAARLQQLNSASLAISAARTRDAVLQIITDEARALLRAHQAVTSTTIDEQGSQLITRVSLSEKYARWRGYDARPDGSGIYTLVHQLNQPLRLTQAELEAHPAWRQFGAERDRHPPMRGWLAVPLVGLDGRNIGLIQLSDKQVGDFTAADEALLQQLARIAAAALENQALYEQERAARAQAEEANRLKDEFLATVSHELRTPLTAFLGYTQLLQRRKHDEAYVARTVEKMAHSAQAQAQLIEDLLDVSRIVSGKLRIQPQPIDLTAVIRAALDTVRPAVEAKDLRLDVDLDPGVSRIVGDANRLQQVVWNLLANAAKFTPAGGSIRVGLERYGAGAQITVSDSGQGIKPDFLPYVFDRFRQADGTSNRAFGGLGLGLAIVRHLVELHGGTVEAASAGEGQGASFIVRLPSGETAAPEDAAADQAAEPAARPPDLAGLRVVAVDDQPDILELLREILEAGGASVRACATAADALEAVRSWRPDVLVSDIAMPGDDGYWLIGQVRALDPAAGGATAAVALTAYVRMEDRLQVLATGFQLYVPKPVDPAELRDAVARVAPRSN
jgi:PAS domain S-box-containing protein